MPVMPPRRCPTCHRLVSGRCSTCSRETSRRRGTRQEQGYDEPWLKLRRWHLDRHPVCVFCEASGRIEPAEQVDHIIPFTSIEDPRRLDPDNLRSLCASCHTRRHNTDRNRMGVSHHGDPRPAKRPPGRFSPMRNEPSIG